MKSTVFVSAQAIHVVNKTYSVIWFNLGMHHMPHTGDLPNTVFSTAHSAITIEPFNYLPGDPSRATTQQVRINSIQGANGSVTSFGAKPVACSVDSVCIVPYTH